MKTITSELVSKFIEIFQTIASELVCEFSSVVCVYLRVIFQVCREWEATALGVDKNVRVALIRIGVVLGKEGGALGMGLELFDLLYY